ncbi:MAG: hypothetical protein WAX38_00775 [Minisyncoccia bacterium]
MKKAPKAQLMDHSHIVKLQSALMVSALICTLMYVYLVGLSVTYAVSEKELAQEKKTISNEVLVLESEFLAHSQDSLAEDKVPSNLVALTEKSFVESSRLGSAKALVVAN